MQQIISKVLARKRVHFSEMNGTGRVNDGTENTEENHLQQNKKTDCTIMKSMTQYNE